MSFSAQVQMQRPVRSFDTSAVSRSITSATISPAVQDALRGVQNSDDVGIDRQLRNVVNAHSNLLQDQDLLTFTVRTPPPIDLSSGSGGILASSFTSGGGASLEGVLGREEIIIARPLNELLLHAKNRKLPSFALIARCIKTLVLSIFTWHLCDHLLLKEGSQIFISSNKGYIVGINEESFKRRYPFLMESAYVLRFNRNLRRNEDSFDFSGSKLTPDVVRQYFFEMFGAAITPKEKNNTIHDLFQSTAFELVKKS